MKSLSCCCSCVHSPGYVTNILRSPTHHSTPGTCALAAWMHPRVEEPQDSVAPSQAMLKRSNLGLPTPHSLLHLPFRVISGLLSHPHPIWPVSSASFTPAHTSDGGDTPLIIISLAFLGLVRQRSHLTPIPRTCPGSFNSIRTCHGNGRVHAVPTLPEGVEPVIMIC